MPSNVAVWKLRVGRQPRLLSTSRYCGVPNFVWLAREVFRSATAALRISATRSGFATATSPEPFTMMPLRFFEPITAPGPPRPKARSSTLM